MPPSKGSRYRRLFCKAEVWSEQACACLWSTDRINTSKVEIKPRQTETLTHTSSSVWIHSRHGGARIRRVPRGHVGTFGQLHTGTSVHTYINTFLQPPIYCELPAVPAVAPVNTACDPLYFFLFITTSFQICSERGKKTPPTSTASQKRVMTRHARCNKLKMWQNNPFQD